MSNPFTPFEITKQMIEYRRNSFFQQSFKTEFTFQQENKYRNKITSVSSQLKNINSIERKITCGDGNSASESSGESSCCEEQLTKLTIDQVVDMVIDTKIYVITNPDPVPSQKGYYMSQFFLILNNQDNVLIVNGKIKIESYLLTWMNRRILVSFQKSSTIHIFYLWFKDKPFIVFESIQLASFQGKLSILIRMKDDNSAQYVYYNLKQSSYKYKRAYGDQIEIGQLRKVGSTNSKESIVVLRYLPINMNDFDLVPDARKEEPFEYKGYKYGIIKVPNLEQAQLLKQLLTKQFISKKYDGIKIQIFNDSNPMQRKKKLYTQFYQDKIPNPEQKLQQIIGLRKEEPRIKIRAPEIRLEETRRPIISAPLISAPQISAPLISAPLLNPEPVRVILRPVQIDRSRSSRKEK